MSFFWSLNIFHTFSYCFCCWISPFICLMRIAQYHSELALIIDIKSGTFFHFICGTFYFMKFFTAYKTFDVALVFIVNFERVKTLIVCLKSKTLCNRSFLTFFFYFFSTNFRGLHYFESLWIWRIEGVGSAFSEIFIQELM